MIDSHSYSVRHFSLGMYWPLIGGVEATALTLLILQEVTTPTPISTITDLLRLGLTGALMMAVIVLWRALVRKDQQRDQTLVEVTKALAFNTDMQKELRAIVESSTRAKEELKEAIDRLRVGIGALPCQLPTKRP